MLREVLLGRSVQLLLGGLAIGALAGADGLTPIAPFYFDLFNGILALFLLEMGLIAADHLDGFRRHGGFMVLFALLVPLVFAAIGIGCAWLMGLSPGGAILLASLAVTFPFNILLGLPLYTAAVEIFYRWVS